jgi:hypothetical protein
MKKSEIPQDKSNFTDLYYAIDDKGNYTTATSSGWNPKTIASDNAIRDINERTEKARIRVLEGKTSPIEYYMEMNKMDPNILSSYVGIWQWRVNRHFKPSVFKKLSPKILKKYADAFDISVDQLKSISK